MEAERKFVCPTPQAWNDIYRKLRSAWESAGRQGKEPPVPLILNGWVFTSDLEKKERWDETLAWAKTHALGHLVPDLRDDQRYEVSEMTTAVRLSFCSASYRELWQGPEPNAPESILCPECGAVLQPDIDQYQGGDKEGTFHASIPSHDRADSR